MVYKIALHYCLNSMAVQTKCSALVCLNNIFFGIVCALVIDADTSRNKESTAEKKFDFLIAVLFINLKQFCRTCRKNLFNMIQQKIAIIGSTSGIGRRMAELYAEKGHRVGISGRRLELLEEMKHQFPQQIEYECFDITGKENITKLQTLINKIGGLDILIISAGTGEPSKELSWKIDKTTVDTNVNGFIEIANWTFNYFLKQDHGQLVTISSVAAIRGGSWAPAYNASKAFQSNYFEGLSIKAGKMRKDITVTCIEPGFVDTKMAKGDGIFWLVPVDKAARQIIRAIEKKKRKVYISRRWWIIAKLMKWAPFWLYRKIG